MTQIINQMFKTGGIASLAIVAIVSAVQPANAIIFTFDITELEVPGGSFGSGSFDTRDPLSPNQEFVNEPTENVFNDVTFTLNNLNNLNASPNTTTFTIDDIPEIIFSTDENSNITNFNIGSDEATNNGDFTAIGEEFFPFGFQLYEADTNEFVNIYEFNNIQEAAPVPFEMETSFGLLALGGFFGLRKLRQRQAKVKG